MKKIILILSVLSLILTLNNCAKKYNAKLKVTNTGNITTIIAIDDTHSIIPGSNIYHLQPGEYDIYEFTWSYQEELTINFTSYPMKFDDLGKNEIITLRDGDFVEKVVDYIVEPDEKN